MSKPDEKTGKTRLQVLLEVKAQTGVVAVELRDLPEIPPETEHVWRWYTDLSSARSAGFSINAIAWSDIHGYFQLMGIEPQRWEILALVALDNAFLASRTAPVGPKVAGADALGARITGKAAKRSK